MVFPAGVATLTWRFNLNSAGVTEEMAQFDINFQTITGTDPVNWDTALLDLATAGYSRWVSEIDSGNFAGSIQLAEVIARGLDSTGHTAAEQTFTAGTEWVGTGNGACLPWQCTLCIGLYAYEPNTFVTNGRNKRGRYYLPPYIVGRIDVNANGTLAPVTVTALLAEQKAFLNGIEGDVGGTFGVVVLSRKTQATHDASWIRADGVIDTQRRRVRSEPKAIQKVALGV